MGTYAINFKSDNNTIVVDAEFYEIINGFVRLYRDTGGGCIQEFCAYCADEISFIALQNKYTEQEVLDQIKGAK